MILSRVWYVLLGLAVAVALYVVYIAVGQYDRQGDPRAEGGPRVRQPDRGVGAQDRRAPQARRAARRQRRLGAAAGARRGERPQGRQGPQTRAEASAKKALTGVNEAIPADWRDDALFAVDRDGRVVAELGFERSNGNDEFELGGYPAVNDALHGWLRDDMWLLGSKMYVRRGAPGGVRRHAAPGGRHRRPQGGRPADSRRTSPNGRAPTSRSTRTARASRRRRRRGVRRGEARRGRGRPGQDRRQDVRRRRALRGAHAHRRPRRHVRAPRRRRLDAGGGFAVVRAQGAARRADGLSQQRRRQGQGQRALAAARRRRRSWRALRRRAHRLRAHAARCASSSCRPSG